MHLRQFTRLRLLRTLKERILRWIGATDEAAIPKYCNEDEPQGAQKAPFRAGSDYFDLVIPAVVNTQKTIRDEKDQPILNAAVLYEVDAVVTGDKDFLSLGLARPRCLTAAQYLRKEW